MTNIALGLREKQCHPGTFTAGDFGSSNGVPALPIMKSTDGGNTWAQIPQVFFHATNVSGGGIILQPDLHELPMQVGNYPAGTILISGNAIPANFQSTNIEVSQPSSCCQSSVIRLTTICSGPC